jgi:hypothetical protein
MGERATIPKGARTSNATSAAPLPDYLIARPWHRLTVLSSDKVVGFVDFLATVSSARRMRGQYTVTWNGRDDRGSVVEQGSYRVVMEASRERRTYQLMQQEVTLAANRVAADLRGNEELGTARLEYRHRK